MRLKHEAAPVGVDQGMALLDELSLRVLRHTSSTTFAMAS
jgi:hypothetical protein